MDKQWRNICMIDRKIDRQKQKGRWMERERDRQIQ